MADVTVSAVVLRDSRGRLLTVRKRGTSRFMLPGGKLETSELPVEAAVREIEEELGIGLRVDELRSLGEWLGPAANEAGHLVLAHVFAAEGVVGDAEPRAEIDAVRWLDPEASHSDDLAPLLTQHVLGLLRHETGDQGSPVGHIDST